MMRDAILNFPKQFAFKPVVENKKKLKKFSKFVVCGMGGSQLAANLLSSHDPTIQVIMHRDYGLPVIPPSEMKKTLFIFSSYSGTTEEVLDGFKLALKKKVPMAAIAIGHTLLDLAKKHGVPYVQIPDTHVQPRAALGFSVIGLFALMQHEKGLREARALAKVLNAEAGEKEASVLAEKLRDRIPVVYASRKNQGVAYVWKIKLNETGKIPAFYNVLPELNHNEMTGFDVKPSSRALSEHMAFIFLTDTKDYPRVQKRMAITKKLYQDRGLPVHEVPLVGKGTLERIFTSLLLAEWTALTLADYFGLESEQVPMVEEFKRLIV